MNLWAHSFSQNANQKFEGFLINFQGRNPSNFWLAFWEKWWPHKFILNLTDLYHRWTKRVFCESRQLWAGQQETTWLNSKMASMMARSSKSFGLEIVSTSKRSQEHTIRISPSAAPLNLENFKTFWSTWWHDHVCPALPPHSAHWPLGKLSFAAAKNNRHHLK